MPVHEIILILQLPSVFVSITESSVLLQLYTQQYVFYITLLVVARCTFLLSKFLVLDVQVDILDRLCRVTM